MENNAITWAGHQKMDRLFIFGDSYSSVIPILTEEHLPRPTIDTPLGIASPGFTWSDGEIWVGHFSKTWASETQLLVYDLAQGGDTVQNMAANIDGPYQTLVKTQSKCNEHWKPANTLFVFWIGINDLAYVSDQQAIENQVLALFGCVQTVYDSGARTFLFIDVPPVNRAPPTVKDNGTSLAVARRCGIWNKCLSEKVQEFSDKHTGTTCFEFSASKFLNRILDDPTRYGFAERDVYNVGAIWIDNIHLSSSVHEKLAEELREYLMTV